jgi:hypothetical protein
MNACQTVQSWITEQIRQPVEQWVSQAEESCTEARRWVERTIRKPIERWRTRVERRCKQRSCNWWCACCNKWFCWLETIVERIVEWVVEVVGEWLVETVCKVIVKLIKIIVEVVITVVRFVVVGVVCLFTDPRGALDALIDFWYDVVDIIGDIGDLLGDLVGAVSDLLDITREFILDLGDRFGFFGRFFFGIVAGILDIARRIVDGVRRIVDGLFDLVVGILHLDFCFALEGLANGVGFGLMQAIFGATGVLSLGGNGARDAMERDELRRWLQGQLAERFEGDTLEGLEDRLSMDSSSFGVSWPVYPLRCVISSRSEAISLASLHDEGIINLYKIAGYAPIGCETPPVYRSVWQLVYKDTDYRVSLGDLRTYLDSGPDAAPEFELIAGDKRVFRDMLLVAERKMRQMAIELDTRPLDTFEIQTRDEMILPNHDAEPLARRIKQVLSLSEICDLPGVIVFGYDPQHFGLASVFWLGDRRLSTAATVRSSFMAHLFGTVLAHEMGHCFSLKHEGHDGMENIMFTLDPSENLTAITGETVVEYVLLGGEPRFTTQDGRDAWTWILTEAGECIGVGGGID